MMGSMGLMMLFALFALFALIAAAVYVGVRLARGTGSDESARSVLDRRFAAGLSAEEYYERESALRSAAPAPASAKGGRGLAGG